MKHKVNDDSKLFYKQLERYNLDTNQGWDGEYRDRFIEMLRPLCENTDYYLKKNEKDRGNGNKRITDLFLKGYKGRRMGIEYHKKKPDNEKICCWFNRDFYEEHLSNEEFPVKLGKNKTQPAGRWSIVQFWNAMCLITDNTQYCINRIAPVDEPIVENQIEIVERIEREIKELGLQGEERETVVKVRVNQGEFRQKLLKKYGKCCLCGVTAQYLLTASHIKPWSQSESFEKLDSDNGFLFCPNHDKLFDKGLISFDDDGKILISAQLSTTDRLFMNVDPTMQINLSVNNKCYLAYHRENVFKG